jgi:hypothetical protein
LTVPLLFISFAVAAESTQKLYSKKNADDVDIISLILGAEVKANNWTKHDLICLSVDLKYPDKKLIKDLRQDGLNVRSVADYQIKFSCGFQVNLRIVNSDSSQIARIRAEVADLRGINSGEVHFAIRIRDGEYLVHKKEGKCSVSEYAPAK